MADPRKLDDRTAFFENEAKNRKAQRPRVKEAAQTISSARMHSAEVGEQLYAASYLTLECIISYTKITEDFATRIWTVEPYSYRYRWLTGGGRWSPARFKKVFFGYDVVEDQIKMFMYGNIHDVTITRTSFTPRWEVEIERPNTAGPTGLSERAE